MVLIMLLIGIFWGIAFAAGKGYFLNRVFVNRIFSNRIGGLEAWRLLAALGALLFAAGALRMALELRPYPLEVWMERNMGDNREQRGRGKNKRNYGVAATVEGRLGTESLKNGVYSLVLKKPEIRLEGKTYRLPAIMVSAEEGMWDEAVNGARDPGMRVKVSGKIKPYEGARNPGEFDYRLYYRSMRMRFQIRADAIGTDGTGSIPILTWAKNVRKYLSGLLDFLCFGDDKGVYKAVLLGDKTELGQDIRELYQKNGIAHILAVSGLHISLIGMGLYGCLRRMGLGFGKAGLLAGCTVFFYGCMTGFGSSVFRAAFMISCAFFASYLGRTYDLLSAMALSLLLLTLNAPFLLFTSGLQLSFGAVFAIGLGMEQAQLQKRERSYEPGRFGSFFDNLKLSLFIQLFTYPIILFHFFEFPIYGIFLNLCVLPLMAYVAGTGFLSLFLYGIGGSFAGASGAVWGDMVGKGIVRVGVFFKAAGFFVMGTGHYILAFYEFLCRAAAKLPFSSPVLGRPKVSAIFLYYAVLMAAHALKCPDARRRNRRFLLTGAVGVILLTYRPVSGLQVTFLDVGQGDGVYLETKDVKILMDSGSSQKKNLGKQSLVPFLKSKGVSKLDYIFVSHGDLDHVSGIEYLLEQARDIRVNNIVFSCLSREDETCKAIADSAKKRGCSVWYMEKGQQIQDGELTLTSLYPAASGHAPDKNEQSLVLMASYGDFSMLLTGDVGNSGEAQMMNLPIGQLPKELTVLKVAHHGSHNSSGADFLDRVSPELSVLSYGNGNSYGHPSEDVVDRLRALHSRIWRTAVSGAVTVKTDGKKVSVTGFVKGERKRDDKGKRAESDAEK